MVSIYASIFCLCFFSLANISTIIHETFDSQGTLVSITWDVRSHLSGAVLK